MPGLRISSHYLQLKKIGLHLQVRAQGAGKKGQGKKAGEVLFVVRLSEQFSEAEAQGQGRRAD